MPNGDLEATLRDYKIAPLGNFFDYNVGLPAFFGNYLTPGQEEFEASVQITSEQINRAAGNNTIIRHDDENNRWSLFFDSESHVVMHWNETTNKYHYFRLYRNAPDYRARRLNIADEDPYINVQEMSTEANTGKITQVFSSQFSSCGFQVVFVGTNRNQPRFLIFSHLQNKSRLASILDDLRRLATEVLAIINITLPDVESVTNCFHRIDQVPELLQRSITFVRDRYLWPENTVQSGFGMSLCGLRFEAGPTLRLAVMPSYNGVFGTATMVDPGGLPVFNCTPAAIRESIEAVRPLLSYRLVWRSKKRLAAVLETVKNHYFELFEQGKFGDGSFIPEFIPEGERARADFIKQFFQLYNARKGLRNLQELRESVNFRPRSKYILWRNAQPIGTIIQQIQSTPVADLANYLVDMRVASVPGEALRRNFDKLL